MAFLKNLLIVSLCIVIFGGITLIALLATGVIKISGGSTVTTTTQIPTTTTTQIPIMTTTTQIPITTTIRPTTTTIRPVTTTTQIPTTTLQKIYNVNSPLSLLQSSNVTENTPRLFFTFPVTGTIKKLLLYCNNASSFGSSDVRIAIYSNTGIFSSSIYAFVRIDSARITYRTGYDSSGNYFINAPLTNTTLINYAIENQNVIAGQKLGVYLSNNTSSNCSFNITGSVEYL